MDTGFPLVFRRFSAGASAGKRYTGKMLMPMKKGTIPMKKILLPIVLLLLVVTPATQAVSLSNVVIPEALDADGQSLLLNGWGVRKKLFLKLYVGALYLPAKSSDAAQILGNDTPVGIRLHILSKLVSAKKMEQAIKEGFAKSTGGNTTAIQQEIDQFLSFFRDNVTEDDIFDIVYTPAKGVHVVLNGRELGVVSGNRAAFRKALFAIWIGEDPVQQDLKDAMLGLAGQ